MGSVVVDELKYFLFKRTKKYLKLPQKTEDMFDPPLLHGAKIFLYIAFGLIAVGAATVLVDVLKNIVPKKDDTDDHKD